MWWEPQGDLTHYKIVARGIGGRILWQGRFDDLANALRFWSDLLDLGPGPSIWDLPTPSWFPGLLIPGVVYEFATVQTFSTVGTTSWNVPGFVYSTSYLAVGGGGGGGAGTVGSAGSSTQGGGGGNGIANAISGSSVTYGGGGGGGFYAAGNPGPGGAGGGGAAGPSGAGSNGVAGSNGLGGGGGGASFGASGAGTGGTGGSGVVILSFSPGPAIIPGKFIRPLLRR
jgi:hypothetical protein